MLINLLKQMSFTCLFHLFFEQCYGLALKARTSLPVGKKNWFALKFNHNTAHGIKSDPWLPTEEKSQYPHENEPKKVP